MTVESCKGGPSASERALDLYAGIGICISEWAEIDRPLIQILSHCMHSDMIAANAVFYEGNSAKPKLAIISYLMTKHAEFARYVTHWRSLAKYHDDLAAMRNAMAHGYVRWRSIQPDGGWSIWNQSPREALLEDAEPVIQAPLFLTVYKPAREITIDRSELMQINDDITYLKGRIEYFAMVFLGVRPFTDLIGKPVERRRPRLPVRDR